MNTQKSGRHGWLLIFHALFWAAAMLVGSAIFKDQPWAEDLVLWMVVGFSLGNGLLMVALGRGRRGC